MSLNFDFSFGPCTPPEYSFEQALQEAALGNGHARTQSNGSQATSRSQDSSPDPVYTQLTTPARSPIRQQFDDSVPL